MSSLSGANEYEMKDLFGYDAQRTNPYFDFTRLVEASRIQIVIRTS